MSELSPIVGLAEATEPCYPPRLAFEVLMHYPHKTSRIKKIRKVGFRARMRTSKGRKIINSKRRLGRSLLTR